MNKKLLINIINVIKYITLVISIICLLKLFLNIKEQEMLGTITISVLLIYIIEKIIMYIRKDKKEVNNIFNSILSSILHIYILLITIRYLSVVDSSIISVDPIYFKINYVIMCVMAIIIIVSDFFTVKPKKKISS